MVCVNLKFYGWPQKTIWHLVFATSSYTQLWRSKVYINKSRVSLQNRNLIVFGMRFTLGTENNSVFQQDMYPDSKVHGANMGPIWGRQDPSGPHVGPMNFAIWVAICEFKLELPSGNAEIQGNLFYICDLDLWPLALTLSMAITFVSGNNSCIFHDDTMTGT